MIQCIEMEEARKVSHVSPKEVTWMKLLPKGAVKSNTIPLKRLEEFRESQSKHVNGDLSLLKYL